MPFRFEAFRFVPLFYYFVGSRERIVLDGADYERCILKAN